MENKKSFIAYSDWKETFDLLPDEIAGKLIKHIFAYVNDEDPITDDFVINIAFSNIKQTLKRDLIKWENQLEQRKQAGKKSAEIRLTKINERSNSFNETKRKATDNVSVSVNDNVNVNVNNNFDLSFISDIRFEDLILKWIEYKKNITSQIQVECAYKDLFEISKGDYLKAEKILNYSINGGYKNFYYRDEKESESDFKTKSKLAKMQATEVYEQQLIDQIYGTGSNI